MGVTQILVLWAGVNVAALALWAIRCEIRNLYSERGEFARDLGWSLMWHERIYEPEDEHNDDGS